MNLNELAIFDKTKISSLKSKLLSNWSRTHYIVAGVWTFLIVFIIGVGSYPFLQGARLSNDTPEVEITTQDLNISPELATKLEAPVDVEVAQEVITAPESEGSTAITTRVNQNFEKDISSYPNRILIPKIGVHTRILQGGDITILDKERGTWLEPYNSTPFAGGNTVIAGHRFQYLPPSQTTFYHLDRLTNGDNIVVIWQGREMVYQVYKTFEVTPDQSQVRNPDPANPNILTLYTCTPIGGNARRLIVQAKLI